MAPPRPPAELVRAAREAAETGLPDADVAALAAEVLAADGADLEAVHVEVHGSLRAAGLADAVTVAAAADGLRVTVADAPAPAPAGARAVRLLTLDATALAPALLLAPPSEAAAAGERAAAAAVEVVRGLRATGPGPLLVADLVPPAARPLGRAPAAGLAALARANARLREALADLPDVTVLDACGAAVRVGTSRWLDPTLSTLAGPTPTPEAAAALAREVAVALRAWTGRTRRLLVVDLDGVLWGGVLGEDGPDGVRLAPDGAGAAYRRVQAVVAGLAARGVLVAVASRNHREDVERMFRTHPHMRLRLEDLAGLEVGWGDKADAVGRLLDALRVAPAHAVVLDDDPLERLAVTTRFPDVLAPAWADDPLAVADRLLEEGWFDAPLRTAEDTARTASVRARADADRALAAAPDLSTLRLAVHLEPGGGRNAERVAQLTQRVTQGNATGRVLTPAEVADAAAAPDRLVAVAALKDRFADHGRVGAVLVRHAGDTATVEGLWVSCRALHRGVEGCLLAAADRWARARGARRLVGLVVPSARNTPVRDVYPRHGFAPAPADGAAATFVRGTDGPPLAPPPFVAWTDDLPPPER